MSNPASIDRRSPRSIEPLGEAALAHEHLLELPQLLVQEEIRLVDQADQGVGGDLGGGSPGLSGVPASKDGGAGTASPSARFGGGSGGGGGASYTTETGGTGGIGGYPGGAGGGGGSTRGTFASGAGGDGGASWCQVLTIP